MPLRLRRGSAPFQAVNNAQNITRSSNGGSIIAETDTWRIDEKSGGSGTTAAHRILRFRYARSEKFSQRAAPSVFPQASRRPLPSQRVASSRRLLACSASGVHRSGAIEHASHRRPLRFVSEMLSKLGGPPQGAHCGNCCQPRAAPCALRLEHPARGVDTSFASTPRFEVVAECRFPHINRSIPA